MQHGGQDGLRGQPHVLVIDALGHVSLQMVLGIGVGNEPTLTIARLIAGVDERAVIVAGSARFTTVWRRPDARTTR